MQIIFGNISNFLLVITVIIAWFTYKKYRNTLLKYLPFYLTYAAILEMGGIYLIKIKMSNVIWYNIGINIEILFYLFIFYNFLKSKKTKKFLLYGGAIYIVYFLLNVFIFESWREYQVFPFTFGAILLIIIIFLFLLEMFQSHRVLHIGKYLVFWISLGLLFYNIIPLPLFVTRSILPQEFTQLMIIQYLANSIMYLLFIYGFIWSSMKYK